MAHSGDSLPAAAESDGFVAMYLIKHGDFFLQPVYGTHKQ